MKDFTSNKVKDVVIVFAVTILTYIIFKFVIIPFKDNHSVETGLKTPTESSK